MQLPLAFSPLNLLSHRAGFVSAISRVRVSACASSIASIDLPPFISSFLSLYDHDQLVLPPMSMTNVSSDPDAILSSYPPPKPCSSPPLADTVVRPFTSQGSSSRTPLQLLTYAYAQHRPDDRPSSAGGLPIDSKFSPYMSASARTSYTRVDIDSLPSPVYPPLPPLPTAFAMQDTPIFVAPPSDGPTTSPDATATTTATPSPTPHASTDTAQPPITEPTIPQTPLVSLTFLLVSGLRKTQSFEPETTVGRVKELVWNAWPARDAGPSLFPLPLRDDRPFLTDALFFLFFRSAPFRLLPFPLGSRLVQIGKTNVPLRLPISEYCI